ncbi:MAG: GNAT family N-acetyltransferase [candidate division WOR-3 bacterium]|nr:GNAT family N-acetyltransferase [candidate division WOR-3 bacterium]
MRMIAAGKKVVLRDALPSDLEIYLKWMKNGEWLKYDAPWENYLSDFRSITVARERFVDKFLHDPSLPRKRAIICAKEDESRPLGWINRYGDKRFPDTWLIGIDICEDDHLNRGLGTEAFRLWIDYLFSNSDIHRIGFATYSFNERMISVGKKLGFTHEGTDREIIYWQNEWVDRLHFGVLRKEWLAGR